MNPEHATSQEQREGKNFRTEGRKSLNVKGLPSVHDNE